MYLQLCTSARILTCVWLLWHMMTYVLFKLTLKFNNNLICVLLLSYYILSLTQYNTVQLKTYLHMKDLTISQTSYNAVQLKLYLYIKDIFTYERFNSFSDIV